MRNYRPTTLKLAAKHCPAAIDFYEQDTPTDRRIFATGTAAHAMLESLALLANEVEREPTMEECEAATLATGQRLIATGRTFDGKPEPPLSPDAAWAARDLVLGYVETNPVQPGADVESGLGVDEHWRPVRYGDAARFRLILDSRQCREESGEESSATVLEITDFKSAWPTDESELDTVQMHSQAVAAWLHLAEPVDCIRVRVVNLRTGVPYVREIWMADGGERLLRRWKDELEITMRALDARIDADGRRIASPGGGCIGCPYVMHCEPGKAWRSKALEGSSIAERAMALAAMEAGRKALIPILKEELGESLFELGPGFVLGWKVSEPRTPVDGAASALWQAWLDRAGDQAAVAPLRTDAFVLGMLEALGLGVSQVEGAAKRMFTPRVQAKERDAFVETLMTTKPERSFGIHKV